MMATYLHMIGMQCSVGALMMIMNSKKYKIIITTAVCQCIDNNANIDHYTFNWG